MMNTVLMDKARKSEALSLEIERYVYDMDCNYIDAVVEYCDVHDIEIEVAASLLDSNIRAKLQADAEDLHFMPKSGRLW